ncbi:MAG: nitroreductase family protein [Candidatus Azobacteroides sp.]|nr:nitroreductase family protein [Candidatus Azobacteroides sp.]
MNEQELLQLMKERKSSRMLFDENRPIGAAVLQNILEAATWAPTAHNMQNFEIVVIDDKSVLTKLSELESAVSPVFLQENYRQLSFTEDELKKKKTGVLATQFPASWLTPEAQHGNLNQPASKLGEQVRRGPVLLLVLYDPNRRAPASENDFLGVMSLGFMMENLWLMAAVQGVSLHILSVFGNEPLSGEVKKMLNIPPKLQIALGVRLGYLSENDAHQLRVRREVNDFVRFNRY